MARRTVEFHPDGHRIRVSPGVLAATWRQHSERIPAQYAVGTAQHESDFSLNEVDTEPSGFRSLGLFQLSSEERLHSPRPMADLLTLEGSCAVLAYVAERRLDAIIRIAGFDPAGALPADVWAYLALAHNQGLGACERTLNTHRLAWSAYKLRNPQLANLGAYGDDCISGGERWPEVERALAGGATVG